VSAVNTLTDWHLEGNVIRFECELSVSRLELLARAGNVDAQVALGRLLAAGLKGAPDNVSAKPWFERAAEAGDAFAQAWMGDCCRMGLAGLPDLAAAESWYRRAAAQDHIGAQIMLANILSALAPSAEADLKEIFGLWLAAASTGNSFAQRNVAECYLTGRGCTADSTAAARWLHLAAQQEDAEAEYELARWYKKGLGVSRNAAAARMWLERAYAHGFTTDSAVLAGP
jgi:TPR repeat protein